MVEGLRDSMYWEDFVSGAEDEDKKAFEVYKECKEIYPGLEDF